MIYKTTVIFSVDAKDEHEAYTHVLDMLVGLEPMSKYWQITTSEVSYE